MSLSASGRSAPDLARLDLRWRVSPKVAVEGVVAALALLIGALLGDPAFVALAAPLALAAVLGLTRPRPAAPEVGVSVSPLVSGPGTPIEVSLTVRSASRCQCHLVLDVPSDLSANGPTRWTVGLDAEKPALLRSTLLARRPGRYSLGAVSATVIGPSAAVVGRGSIPASQVVESWPFPISLRTLVRPFRVRATTGDQVARLASEGIEFAEIREEQAATIERRINWRATARRGVTCVNFHHPERSTDVVLLVDTFSEQLLPLVISIAMSLADSHLRRHDRVGLVGLGGLLDWVEPGTGTAQLERIRRSLLSSQVFLSYAWKSADIIPRRLFTAGCLVLAVTPLGDARFIDTLAGLRARQTDLAIVEVEPPWRGDGASSEERLVARRIIALERSALRQRFGQLAVPLVVVRNSDDLAAAMAQMAILRRVMRGARWRPAGRAW